MKTDHTGPNVPRTAINSVPFKGCYWVTAGLLAGPTPYVLAPHETLARLKSLREFGVGRVIALLGDAEMWWHQDYDKHLSELGIELFRFQVEDGDAPSEELAQSILHAIDAASGGSTSVYVHCIGGRGRTGTVIGCRLARHGRTGSEALTELAQIRTLYGLDDESPETSGQRALVQSFGR